MAVANLNDEVMSGLRIIAGTNDPEIIEMTQKRIDALGLAKNTVKHIGCGLLAIGTSKQIAKELTRRGRYIEAASIEGAFRLHPGNHFVRFGSFRVRKIVVEREVIGYELYTRLFA